MKDDPGFHRLERLLGRLMLAGVTSSAACLLLGLVLFLTGAAPAATIVITVGLVTLMATPALRVFVAVVESVRMRDWFFLASTLSVVAMLGLTLMWALRAG
jgi:uncharacterized membrane protein